MIATLALFVAFSLFVIPFHYYDMVALTVLFMMIIVTPLAGRWLIGAGLLLAYRPDFIWRGLGVANPDEILLTPWVSAGLLLTVAGAVVVSLRMRHRASRGIKLISHSPSAASA